MYQIKNSIFLELTKNQKSDFLSFVKIYTKNYRLLDVESIVYNILDELEYLHELNKYEYFDINNDKQVGELRKYVVACKKHLDYKEAMRPAYEEQKRIQKEIRAKITEEKQKKEPPTKKQISYYKSLCKKNNEAPKPIDEMSKYDIKIEISRLVTEAESEKE